MPNQKVIVITLELATFLSDDSSILFHGRTEQTTTRNQIGIVEEIHKTTLSILLVILNCHDRDQRVSALTLCRWH